MPFTTNKGYSVQAAGTNAGTWGAGSTDSLNDGVIEILDDNLGGSTSLSLSASNVLLTQAQARNGLFQCAGTLLANVQISPDAGVLMTGFYFWENVTTGNFTVTFSNGVGSAVTLPQSRRGILWVDSTSGPRIFSSIDGTGNILPSGTSMVFYNTAVPSGWTVVGLNDYALKVVSASGGVTSGSVAYSTLFGRTTTDNHTLTLAQIPSHSHTYTAPTGSATDTSTSGGGWRLTTSGSTSTGSSGGGDAHSHNIDMRVQTASVLIGTKI